MNEQDRSLMRRINKKIKAKPQIYRIITHPGFEKICKAEIQSIINASQHISCVGVGAGTLKLIAKQDDMWKIHQESYCTSKIYWEIGSFRSGTEGAFIKKIKLIDWEIYLPPNSHLKIASKLKHCRIPDGPLLSRMAEREISRLLRNKEKPPQKEEQCLLIRGEENQFSVSINCSGAKFYARGYRKHQQAAPLRETLAASMLLASHFKTATRVIDPMCGSGTFSLEAKAMLCSFKPGAHRKFPFMSWPSFRINSYEYLLKQEKIHKKAPPLLLAFDNSLKAIEATQNNQQELIQQIKSDLKNQRTSSQLINLTITKKDFFELQFECGDLILLNPPYGKRIEKDKRLYQRIGEKIKKMDKEIHFGIIVPGEKEESELALPIQQKYLFFNGGLKCAFLYGTYPTPG